MSGFKAEVVRIDDVVQHPNADRLKICKIKGFDCISGDFEDGTSQYKAGDLAVYIPENAVLPLEMLRYNGFYSEEKGGLLSGKDGNRVKAIKLRGVVSQGILHPVTKCDTDEVAWRAIQKEGVLYNPITEQPMYVDEGDDVTDALGITKYVPEIPASMSGEVVHIGTEYTVKYDIENIQKYPGVLEEGEYVYVTEKLHGTFCGLGYDPRLNHPDLIEGKFFAFSKGLGAQGLVFKNTEENRTKNVYQKALLENLDRFKAFIATFGNPIGLVVCGEVFGPGIQDLHYGQTKASFRVFDIYARMNHMGMGYADASELAFETDYWDMVPTIYEGPLTNLVLLQLRDGKTTLGEANIREGIVIKPAVERDDPELGRVILKFVSPDYLLRKGNATEFN